MLLKSRPLITLTMVCAAFAGGGICAAPAAVPATSPEPYVLDREGKTPAPHIAIDNVCAWPRLTALPDGTITAMLFSQPSHGRLPGDVECWATTDEGLTWSKRGTPAPRDDDSTNRMGNAVGLAANGDLIVIASGWTLIKKPSVFGDLDVGDLLRAFVSRSSDGGRTWKIDREGFPAQAPDGLTYLPTGAIRRGKDGSLRMAGYTTRPDNKHRTVYILQSTDDGHTWGHPQALAPSLNQNETYLWTNHRGWWLATVRSNRLDLYESVDDAATWQHRGPVTEPEAYPGQLLQLADGRILLMNGNRAKGHERVEVRVSADRGKTWTAPAKVVDFETFDGGYPSSVQLKDGRVLTAFYARKTSYHDGYHMGTVIWDPARTFPLQP